MSDTVGVVMKYLLCTLILIFITGCSGNNNGIPDDNTCEDQCSNTEARYCQDNAIYHCIRNSKGCFEIEKLQQCSDQESCYGGNCLNSDCSDECYHPNTATCDSDTTRLLCGNFDDDICLEEIKRPCDNGLSCMSGRCIDLVSCNGTCQEWEACQDGACILKENSCNVESDCTTPLLCDTTTHLCRYPANICQGIACSDHGTCYPTNNSSGCICDEGYHAVNLECLSTENPCESITCSNHGTCLPNNGFPYCKCDDFYHPEQWNCISDVNQCTTSCNEWEWCVDYNCAVQDTRCTNNNHCKESEFCHISSHTCRPKDPCTDANCFTNSICVAQEGTGWCQCTEGYTGPYCDQCEPGYQKSGTNCLPCIDSCQLGDKKCDQLQILTCILPEENLCPEWQITELCSSEANQICASIDQQVACFCEPGYHLENGNCISGCDLDCGSFGVCTGGTDTLYCQCIDTELFDHTFHHYGSRCEYQCEHQCSPGERICDPVKHSGIQVCQEDENGCYVWDHRPFCNDNINHLEQCHDQDGTLSCICHSNYERCGDHCYNTSFNKNNCGGCGDNGTICEGSKNCIDGICQWGCANDAFEPNNTVKTASLLGSGTFLDLKHCVNNGVYDIDYYLITDQKGVIRVTIIYPYIENTLSGDQSLFVDLIASDGSSEEVVLQSDLNHGYIYLEYHVDDERTYYLKTKQFTGTTIKYQIISEHIERQDQERSGDRCFLEDLAIERGNVQAIRDGNNYFYRLCEDIHQSGSPILSGPQPLNRGACGTGTTNVVTQVGCLDADCDDDTMEGGDAIIPLTWSNKKIELKAGKVCSGSSDLYYIALNPNTSYHLEVNTDQSMPPLYLALYDLKDQNGIEIDYTTVQRNTLNSYYSEMDDQKRSIILFRTPSTIMGKVLKIYPLYGAQITYDLTIIEGE